MLHYCSCVFHNFIFLGEKICVFNLKLSEIDRNRQILLSKDIFSLLKK